MRSRRWRPVAALIALAAAAPALRADEPAARYDLSKDKVLYCVGYAHLDTQWRWDFCTTIDRYLRDTLEHNFDRFDKYPGYVFNFTGSVRYEMMKEYYPEHYARLREHIAAGRWHVSGSSVDEGDVNVPSAESVIRQVLYGNQLFRREFGKESLDFMLPDCFGFPASMPSIWAHCGLKGFSTQKLTWRSAVGIPFKVGVWEGLDGRGVIAAFDPGPYVGGIKGRVDLNDTWAQRVETNGEKYGVFADYHYYGVGDMGGAPREEDIANYLASIDNPDSRFKVALTSSDQMFRDITPEQAARLPRYKGDLLLIEHSAGTLTSQAYMKRWNRKNEQLADAAERAAAAAHWLGGATYPREKLYRSWVRALANQMHDILPGTSIPRAYRYSWNDEIVALNGFAAVLTDAVGAVTRGLDTAVEGAPLVVYNPLAIEREDLVDVEVFFTTGAPERLAIYDPAGAPVPSQVRPHTNHSVVVTFPARVPPLSWSVYTLRPGRDEPPATSALRVTERTLENEHYVVTLNDDGDVAGIVDKAQGGRELLAGPARLVFTYEKPEQWPAWNMDWADRQKPPIDMVRGPAKVTVVERGPVRVALRVEREARGSIFVQEIRLTAGDAGRRIEFHNEIDWQSAECALKASFPLAASNPNATYNWEMGTIARGNNEPTKFEVPSHQWFDLTDASGSFGVSILEDCKYGSDKPTDNELRLTLLYTPGVRTGYLDQHSQDWGRHDITYAVYGHAGDWRDGRTEWQARRLNQPLRAFFAAPHAGGLGRRFSLMSVSTPQVDVRALKLAEESEDQLIVRAQELWGKAAEDVAISFASPVAEAYEVDGQERRIGPATVREGRLVFAMTPYSPKSFAVRLAEPPVRLAAPRSVPVVLPYNVDVISHDANRADGALDAEGRTFPAEMLPPVVVSEGIEFRLGPSADGQLNAIACKGQTLTLPPGDHDRLYLLAAGAEDVRATIRIGDQAVQGGVQGWTGFIGQWDDREWERECEEVDFRCEGKVTGLRTGFIKRDNIAWFATHRHHPSKGNEAYQFSYLYKYALPVSPGATTIVLPDEPRIVILAASVAKNPNDEVSPAMPLYDDFSARRPVKFRYEYPPPPKPVFDGLSPRAAATVDRQATFAELRMGPPSKEDYADAAAGHGAVFRTLQDDPKRRPHGGSGVVNGTLPRLNDGEVAANHDDTARCVWYDNEGRFHVDLGRSVEIDRINTYSWHRTNRAPQYFSLWGSAAETMPPVDFRHGDKTDWTLLAVVDSRELGQGGIHGSSVTGGENSIGAMRHLLWIAEDVGEGTFFTEIDVHARP